MKIQDVNEFDLIQILTKHISPNNNVLLGVGDDAAVLKLQKNTLLVATTDSQVEDVHFSRTYSTPQQIGQRAVNAAVSDIAAMGATPCFLLISLFLPADTKLSYVKKLYSGVRKAAKKHDIAIVGGNMSKAKNIIVDVCALGEVLPEEAISRSGAKIGDVVCVTGTLGNAHAALLQKRYFAINPRIEEGKLLAQSGKVTAMIDISDGLSSDLLHICQQSSVGVEVFLDKLPKHTKVPYDFALHGGEDYELCFTIKPQHAESVIKTIKEQTETNVTIIGKILPKAKGQWLIYKDGRKLPLIPLGWKHFSP